jgi:hypothetical protein
VRPTDVPSWSLVEIYVGDRMLAVDDARIGALFAQLVERFPAAS